MCYNGCTHHRFNPMTGEDRCARGTDPCPEEELECEKCGDIVEADNLHEHGHNFWVCGDCLETLAEE